MRIEYISKLMGHGDIKTTQVNAKIVNAELDEAMDVFNESVVKYNLRMASHFPSKIFFNFRICF